MYTHQLVAPRRRRQASLAFVDVPPLEVLEPGEVVRVRAGDDEEVEQLVAVADEVEPPRRPPLGDAGRVHGDAEPVERAHEHLVERGRHSAGRGPAVEEQLVRDGNHARRAQAREERAAERAQLGRLERRHQRRRRRRGAERVDGAHVEPLQRRVAEEGVLGERVKGGGDQRDDAGVIEPERHVRRALRVAQDQVAHAARQQAQHRAGEVREQRPPRHGDGGGGDEGRAGVLVLDLDGSMVMRDRGG
uniref:Uncharacterized protein n=1 Tax=Arundo donax TaxID=35708 RepID=A0A0A9GQD2_ARUDO